MGRHAAPERGTENQRTFLWPDEQAGGSQAVPLAEAPLFVKLLLGLGVLALVFGLVSSVVNSSGSSTSRSTSSSGTSTSAAPYWETERAESWWVDAKGEFAARLREYSRLTGYSYAPAVYQIGIRNCMAMRADQTDDIVRAKASEFKPGQTWAIVNTAIDVYCPDQESYRDLVAP